MRGELYITQLIRLSDAAETYALSLRPPGAARHLSIREELDSLPLDQAERRFADLAKRLPELLESKPPPHFAESHLPKLFKRTARQALASVLGCTADDVLPTLLDPVPISREIENVAAQVRLSRPVAILVEDLLIQLNAEPVRRAIRHRWGFSETAWGRHLEARRWIKRLGRPRRTGSCRAAASTPWGSPTSAVASRTW